MSVLSKTYFHDEAAAFEFVEGIIWNGEPSCPHCGIVGKVYDLKGVRSKASKKNPEGVVRHGLKKCASCRKQFTVRVGTIFEESHLPLHKWLQAIYLMCSSKKGISAKQLERTLEVQYKTAWFLGHRIREAMRDTVMSPMGGEGVTLEVDETFLGKQATIFVSGKGWQGKRGTGDMRKIVTLVERGGRSRSVHVQSLRKEDIAAVMAHADRASVLNTDQAQHYRRIGAEFTAHGAVDHGRSEYARYENGQITTTNTIEGFFSIFKRGMKGIYQHCSEKHLQRYLAEFDFRYSNRSALGCEDQERAMRAVLGGVGKRLTYRLPHVGTASA